MRVALDSFLKEVCEKTTENNQFPVLTSSKAGLFLQSDYFNKQVASNDNTGYKIIRRGQFTYRAMSDTGEFFPNMLECADIGIVSPAYPVFEITKKNDILPEFLKYYFKSDSFQYSISSFAQGSTRTSVKFSKLKTVSIDLPSVDKQREIIEILNLLKTVIAAREKEVQHFDNLVKARFVEMFENGNYQIEKLGAVCNKITDGTHKTPTYLDDGITFISAKNIVSGELDFTDVKHISEDEYQEIQKRCQTAIYDILLSKSGSLGAPAIVKTEEKLGLFESLAVLKYDRGRLLPEFLCEQLKTDRIQRQFTTGTKGVAIKHLHLGVIADTDIIVPPLDEQKTFSAFVSQIDKSKFVVQQALDKAQLLFDSLMQKYFG